MQEEAIAAPTGTTRLSPLTGSNSSNKQRVSFSEEVCVRSYTIEEASDSEEDASSEDGAEVKPGPSASAEPVCAPRSKRGRPPDTPLQKAKKVMERAEKRKKDAKSALFEERDEFKRGAFWDKQSEAKRVKERILRHADQVLDLQYKYEEAREAWVQARIDDAVQRALRLERAEASEVYASYERTLSMERRCVDLAREHTEQALLQRQIDLAKFATTLSELREAYAALEPSESVL